MTDLERVLSLTDEILQIESVTGDEGEIGDWLEQLVKQQPHTLIRAGYSLCFAMRPPEPDRPTLMLVGHTDTVPRADDNPVRPDGNRLHGLRASDMKAADAVLFDRIERDPGGRYNLVGVPYAREEGPFADSEMPAIIDAAGTTIVPRNATAVSDALGTQPPIPARCLHHHHASAREVLVGRANEACVRN